MRFGDVYELNSTRDNAAPGREISGQRYGIVVRDLSGQSPYTSLVFAIPTTTAGGDISKISRAPMSFIIPQNGTSGLFKPCVALVFQLAPYDKAKFGKKLGELEPHLQNAVRRHIKVIFSDILEPL